MHRSYKYKTISCWRHRHTVWTSRHVNLLPIPLSAWALRHLSPASMFMHLSCLKLLLLAPLLHGKENAIHAKHHLREASARVLNITYISILIAYQLLMHTHTCIFNSAREEYTLKLIVNIKVNSRCLFKLRSHLYATLSPFKLLFPPTSFLITLFLNWCNLSVYLQKSWYCHSSLSSSASVKVIPF